MSREKEKRAVSLPKRIILVAVQLICAAAVGVSGMGLIYCLENDLYGKSVVEDDYLDTDDCAQQSYYQFVEALNGEMCAGQFMADDGLNLNQTVDITKLEQGIFCGEKDPATTYTLKQLNEIYDSVGLVPWLEEISGDDVFIGEVLDDEDTEYDIGVINEGETATEEYMEVWTAEEMQEYREAFSKLLEGLDQKELLEYEYSDEFVYMYYRADEVEIELPESGERLADYALTHPEEVSLWDLYWELADAELRVGEFIWEVRNGDIDEQTVWRNSINTMYYVEDLENDKVYTNVEEWKTLTWRQVQDSLTEGQQTAMYAYQWRDGGRTNQVTGSMAYGENLSKYVGRDGSSYASDTENVLVLLDTTLPYADTIAARSKTYLPVAELAIIFPIVLAAAAAGCVITGVFFCMWTGRRRYVADETGAYVEEERAVSKIPVELLLVIDIILVVVFYVVIAAFDVGFDMYPDALEWMAIGGGWCLALAVLVEVIVYPLLAKGKTSNWQTNSLCALIAGGIGNSIRKAYESRKITGKLTIVFLAVFVIEMIILAFMASTWLFGCGVILFVILNAAIYFFLIRVMTARQRLIDGIDEIAGGNLDYQIDTANMVSDDKHMAERMNNVREGMQNAMKEQMKSERLRTDLITNVSHDIKTPLTSIINYVDLLKREDIQDDKMAGYVEVLDRKSQRLKQLTEDLVEASKISSGNVTLQIEHIDLKQLIKQISGEFEEKFEKRGLSIVMELPQKPMLIMADGRRMSRVIENLYNNAAKYAMPGSRVYAAGDIQGEKVIFSMKNMSEYPLNISAEELMERFVRGDLSRTTEGSGLGLEIARNLTLMQKGDFNLYLDGDLFKVTLEFESCR